MINQANYNYVHEMLHSQLTMYEMNVNAQYRLVRLVLMYGIIFYGFIRVS